MVILERLFGGVSFAQFVASVTKYQNSESFVIGFFLLGSCQMANFYFLFLNLLMLVLLEILLPLVCNLCYAGGCAPGIWHRWT